MHKRNIKISQKVYAPIALFLFMLFTLLMLVFMSAFASATAISMPPSTLQPFLFVPNKDVSFRFYVHDAPLLSVKLEGDQNLIDAATLTDPMPDSGSRFVSVSIHLPEYLTPGIHTLYLSATDISPKKGQIKTIAKVMAGMKVKVLSDEKKITASVDAEDVSVNETTTISVNVESWTNQVINSLFSDVVITDNNSVEVGKVRTNVISLEPNKKETLTAKFNTKGLRKGIYNLHATVYFDGNKTEVHGDFKIGDILLTLKRYDKTLPYNKTSKFEFILLNEWNRKIKNVYSKVEILRQSVKTPSDDIKGFSERIFNTFLSTEGFEEGNYSGTITSFYEGKNTTYPITIRIIKSSEKKEWPTLLSKALLSSPLILYLLLLILIILNIILLFKKNKKDKKKEEENKGEESYKESHPPQEPPTSSDSLINR